MPTPERLTAADATAVTTLFAAAAESRGDTAQRLVHVFNGLCELLHAKNIGLNNVERIEGGGIQMCAKLGAGYWNPREVQESAEYIKAHRDAAGDDPFFAAIIRRAWDNQRGVVYRRPQLVDDPTWRSSRHVRELRNHLNIGESLYGLWAESPGGRRWSIGIHRARRTPQYTERQRILAQVVWRAAQPMLIRLDAPAEGLAGVASFLPTRQRHVLNALADGLSEKQIAVKLGLTRHTIHASVKALHKRFGVASRGELLALVLGSTRDQRTQLPRDLWDPHAWHR